MAPHVLVPHLYWGFYPSLGYEMGWGRGSDTPGIRHTSLAPPSKPLAPPIASEPHPLRLCQPW